VLSGLIACLAATASAQPAAPPPAAVAQKRAQAVRVPNGSITVDGQLNEAVWQTAPPARDFVQQQPREGTPATESSEVRFLYDDDNLYVGGRYIEREVEKLVVNELKRDFVARDGDLIVLLLDTFSDRLNAYNFQTNPGCALRDSQSSDDGRYINANWDGVWTCRSTVGADGFVIEQAIPFKQLRFPRTRDQVWGMNIFRLIRHSNEQTIWNPVPRQFNQFKMSYAGILEGLRDIKPGRDIRVKPFVLGKASRAGGVNATDWDGGLDVKVGLASNLVLDGTWRTDFSQVEVDTQQVNLTRFNQFFPEKREFFLENQGAFQIGGATNASTAFVSATNDLVPFFSRTIGLSDSGTPIPIVGGLRLSGRVGRGTIGVLSMRTEDEPRAGQSSLPAATFSVARYAQDFLSNSTVGVFVLDKERGDVSNRVAGAEIRLNLNRTLNIDGLALVSDKTGVGSGAAFRGGITYEPGRMALNLSYIGLGDDFRDDLGFIPRQGVNILSGTFMRRLRPAWAAGRVREFRATLPGRLFLRDPAGIETVLVAPAFTAEFQDASTATVTVEHREEFLDKPFRPQGMPTGHAIAPGRYLFDGASLAYVGSNSRRFAPTGELHAGGFYDGDRVGAGGGLRVRFSRKLATTASVSRDHLDAAGVTFDTTLVSLRIDGSFSTRMFLNAFVQYNSVTKQVLTNVRYDFIHHPLSDLFVVLTDTRATSGGTTPPTRSLAVKYTHLFSF
jgi:hypothetical protein